MIQLSYSWVFIQRKLVEKDICTTQVFTAALFTTVKTWKQPKYPLTDEWIKKMWCYMDYGILLNQKNEIMPFEATWIDLETIILN